MATTTESIRLHEFEDPDFQRLYGLLKNAAGKADSKSKAVILRSLAKQSEELAAKLDGD